MFKIVAIKASYSPVDSICETERLKEELEIIKSIVLG